MPHSTTIEVRFYEADPYGHVNHAAYFHYFEAARMEALRSIGWGLAHLESLGLRLVVVGIEATFEASPPHDAVLDVHTWATDAGRVSMVWEQMIEWNGKRAATARVRSACVNTEGKPTRMPPELVSAALAFTPPEG